MKNNNKTSLKFEKEIALLSSCINKAKRKNLKNKNTGRINPLLISNFSILDKTDILKNKEHQNHFNNRTYKKINKFIHNTSPNSYSNNYDFSSNKNQKNKNVNKKNENYQINKNRSVRNFREINNEIYIKPKLATDDYRQKVKKNANLLNIKDISILCSNNMINFPNHKKVINNLKQIYTYTQKEHCINNDCNNETPYNPCNFKLLSNKYSDERFLSTDQFGKTSDDINSTDCKKINNKTSFNKEIDNLYQENKLCMKKCKSYFTNNVVNNTTNEISHNNLLKNNIINKNSDSNFRTQKDLKKKKDNQKYINSALNQNKFYNIFTSTNANINNVYHDRNEISQKNNSIDYKYKELLNLLEVNNIDEGIDKVKKLLTYEKFIVQLKNLCIKYDNNKDKRNGNDILNLNDIYLWISSSLENNKQSFCYKNILVDLMNAYNINNLNDLKKFINSRVIVKKKNDNFVYKIKNILCESNALINGNNIYSSKKRGKNSSSVNISRIHGNILPNMEDSVNNSEDININNINLNSIRK